MAVLQNVWNVWNIVRVWGGVLEIISFKGCSITRNNVPQCSNVPNQRIFAGGWLIK